MSGASKQQLPEGTVTRQDSRISLRVDWTCHCNAGVGYSTTVAISPRVQGKHNVDPHRASNRMKDHWLRSSRNPSFLLGSWGNLSGDSQITEVECRLRKKKLSPALCCFFKSAFLCLPITWTTSLKLSSCSSIIERHAANWKSMFDPAEELRRDGVIQGHLPCIGNAHAGVV